MSVIHQVTQAPLTEVRVFVGEDFVARCEEIARASGIDLATLVREGMRRELGRLERRLVAQRYSGVT
jgi:hypothetical protein